MFMKRQECVYCGAAPVNHLLHWVTASVDITVGSTLGLLFSRLPDISKVERFAFVRWLLRGTLALLALLKIIRYENSVGGASARTRVIWDEAVKRGIPIQHVLIFGTQSEYCRAYLPTDSEGGKKEWLLFESLPVPFWMDSQSPHVIDNKSLFKKLFDQAHLPTADGVGVYTRSAVIAAFHAMGGLVAVKPQEGSRARHTSVRIADEPQLLAAFAIAKQLCPIVMIEKFIPGVLYRATCVDGKIVGVIKFIRPTVTADGSMTVGELLAWHNSHKKFPNLTEVKNDWWFREAITHQGFAIGDVPVSGILIALSEHSERPNGGYFIDVTDSIPLVHKNTIERGAVAARIPVIGFDIISEDLADPNILFAFIEGNALPFIELHHIPYEGKVRDVAAAVWDLWEPRKISGAG